LYEYFSCGGEDVQSNKNQSKLYLDESRMMNDTEGNFDILSYYKGNEFCYLAVAAMARDILSIHISIVALESTFSVSDHVINQYRSLLKPDIVEALVCTRDWFYEEKGNICYLYIYFFH
jgi:hypothetical protein